MDKVQLRARGKQIMANFSTEEKNTIEHELAEHLYNSMIFKQASTIGITISQKNEWSTTAIIERAWKEGKRVTVPKCDPGPKHLNFYQLDSFDQLETVYFGLQEPDPSRCEHVDRETIDLIIVPGLVFDLHGYRIGYGGGFYDRYLSGYKGETVALASKEQVVKNLPHEKFDIPVNHLITEDGYVF